MSSQDGVAATLVRYLPVDAATWENIQAQGKTKLETLKPAREFFDKNRFSVPRDFNEFSGRLSANLRYFQSNYILLGLVAVLYSLITNLWLLFAVAFVIVGVRFISTMPPEGPVSFLNGKLVITSSQAWMALACISVLLLWFTSAGTTIFWIASVVVMAVAFHAGFMQKPLEDDFGASV
ncbi:PRA1 family protein-domain-containing protein [Zopfochytrium polystomum]|nr:PRA1 family protein-domain-containing protein [Zopfochytrium polystomum]